MSSLGYEGLMVALIVRVKKLVVPRLVACVILMPVLTVFADVVGFAGAMGVARVQFDTPMGFFFRTALESINMQDFMSGLGKAPFFGVNIAMIGCYYGMHTRGGTEGVGRRAATGRTWAWPPMARCCSTRRPACCASTPVRSSWSPR